MGYARYCEVIKCTLTGAFYSAFMMKSLVAIMSDDKANNELK